MTVSPLHSPHPVLACAASVHAALDAVSAVDPAFMTAVGKRAALVELTRAGARLEALRLRVLAAGQALGDVAAADGSRDAAAWLAHHGRIDAGRARWLGRLAIALDERYAAVAAALREGRLDLAQADVIARALDDLPDDLDPDTLRLAEERLVAEAETFDPRRLRVLGQRILEVVAPDVAEDHARRALEDEEARARASTFLRVRRRGDGTTDIHARLADTVANRLLTLLHAYTSPRQHHPPRPGAAQSQSGDPQSGGPQSGGPQSGTKQPGSDGAQPSDPQPGQAQPPSDRRPYDRKLGHALGSLLEHLDPQRLPLHGGDATTVVVTVPLADLQDQLDSSGVAGAARVGDQPLTPGQARRLACTAQILPAVLGTKSQVLDLGRSSRLFSPAQRKALALRHPTCAAQGCTIPAPWCEAHHATTPWSRGGRTDLADGVLLCSHHHHRAHDPRYDTTRHPDTSVSFHRRE